ncbi:MAG: Ig-like domain-containing protein [Phycisphaerae bacterium]|jgi:hypothetical protein
MRKNNLIKSLMLTIIFLLTFSLPVFAKDFPIQLDVPVNKEWKITFSKPVDITTLQNNISLRRTDISESAFSITPQVDPVNPKIVIIKHSTPFVEGANYSLSVSLGVKDTTGKVLSDSTNLSFKTHLTASTTYTSSEIFSKVSPSVVRSTALYRIQPRGRMVINGKVFRFFGALKLFRCYREV